MRRFLLLAAALAASAACEQRFSASPPPAGPATGAPAASINIDSLIASTASDAGPSAVEVSHAIIVTLCASTPAACAAAIDTDASAESSYHVVFGSGRGVVRSRGQAMADLYKELRDRIAGGERLDAEPLAKSDGGTPLFAGGSSAKAGSDSDPVSECAFHLLDVVDGVGGVTLDVVHASGVSECSVSLGAAALGAASRCLVKAPERPHRFGR